MADSNAVAKLYPQLFQAVLADEWRRAVILAADLKAAHEQEQTFAPWTPHNTGNTR